MTNLRYFVMTVRSGGISKKNFLYVSGILIIVSGTYAERNTVDEVSSESPACVPEIHSGSESGLSFPSERYDSLACSEADFQEFAFTTMEYA